MLVSFYVIGSGPKLDAGRAPDGCILDAPFELAAEDVVSLETTGLNLNATLQSKTLTKALCTF